MDTNTNMQSCVFLCDLNGRKQCKVLVTYSSVVSKKSLRGNCTKTLSQQYQQKHWVKKLTSNWLQWITLRTRSPAVARMADRTVPVVKLSYLRELVWQPSWELDNCPDWLNMASATADHAHCSNSYHFAVAQSLLYVAQT